MKATNLDIINDRQEQHFPSDSTGNPVFDLKIPRTIELWAIRNNPSIYTGMPGSMALKNYFAWEWEGQTEFLYDYERNEKTGEIRVDKDGCIVPKMERQFLENLEGKPSEVLRPKYKEINIPNNSCLRLSIPRDNYLIQQLLRCPAVANISEIDGKSTISYHKYMVIYDPYFVQKANEVSFEHEKEAMIHAYGVKEKDLNPVYALLDIGSPYTVSSVIHKRSEITEFAKKHPYDYIEKIMNKFSPEKALFRLAECKRLIRIDDYGYSLQLPNEKPINMGITHGESLEFLRKDIQSRNQLILLTGYNPDVEEELVAVQKNKK